MPAEAWEAVKGTIRQLYLEERKPLKEVIQVMADQHGFQATYVLIRHCPWPATNSMQSQDVQDKVLPMGLC